MDKNVSLDEIVEFIKKDETWDIPAKEREMFVEGLEWILLGF